MAKEYSNQRKGTTNHLANSKAKEPTCSVRRDVVWQRDDGAWCVGDECLVIKPSNEGKDLNIEIAPSRCGEEMGELISQYLIKTIGKGGSTNFKIKSILEGD